MKFAWCIAFSLIVHVGALAAFNFDSVRSTASHNHVTVKIVHEETSAADSSPLERPVEQPQPSKPVKELPKPKAKGRPAPKTFVEKSSEPTPQPQPETQTSNSAVSDPAGGSKAPSGNETASLDKTNSTDANDLSTTATLDVHSFEKPRFTRLARKARYELAFVADVRVDKHGRAKEVRFDHEILYEMDQRIIQSLKRARFKPARNRFGHPMESWVSIPFRLEMED